MLIFLIKKIKWKISDLSHPVWVKFQLNRLKVIAAKAQFAIQWFKKSPQANFWKITQFLSAVIQDDSASNDLW